MLRNALSKIALISLILTLAACGSSVKLSDVPVEDRAGSSTAGSAGDAAASGAARPGVPIALAASTPTTSRSVAPMELAPTPAAAAAGPVNVERIILFDYDSFVIKPEFQTAIEGHARFLNANKTRRISVEGHTDERGGREYNLALGQKRSEAVRRALTLLGVSEGQIEAVSLGKEKPAVAGESEEAFRKNRRAEIVYR